MEIQGKFIPPRLKKLNPPTTGLWWRGNKNLVKSEKIVAIVGSRKMSQYGKQVLAQIVPLLVEQGYVTVSGFMYGIDIEMHRLTIENDGKTIGVFGWGIEAPIMVENENLYHKVIEREGLFLSEFPPDQLGTLWTFPKRNRIVVGLCDLVFVIEAGMKSGSLNSCEWARKMGKPVYAVPGSIFSKVSQGCNWLIEQGLAKPLTLDFFTHKNYSEKVRIRRHNGKLNNDESILITRLRLEGPQSLNEVARGVGKPVGEVSSLLMSLLLKGEVKEERGVWLLN